MASRFHSSLSFSYESPILFGKDGNQGQQGDLVKADKMLHIALKQAQDIGHEEAVTHIFVLMANLAKDRELFGQAERLFTTVLQRLLSAGEPQVERSTPGPGFRC